MRSFSLMLLYVRAMLRPSEKPAEEVTLKPTELLERFSMDELKKLDEPEAKRFIFSLLKMRLLFDGFIIANAAGANGLYTFNQEVFVEGGQGKARPATIREDRADELYQAMLWASFGMESTNSWLFAACKALFNLEPGSTASLDEATIRDQVRQALEEWERRHVAFMPKGSLRYQDVSLYYFYKLDYLLWCQSRQEEETNPYGGFKATWDGFQIRPNRSIEHIFPQAQLGQGFNEQELHAFGNLALISASSNSGFSDKTFAEKKAQFEAKLESGSLESLKQFLIFQNKDWTPAVAQGHEYDMRAMLGV